METLTVQGVDVPRLGFGTWQISGQECTEAVRDALKLGYRHIDTARAYENEREVGEGIRAAGVQREEVFLTTKVWLTEFEPDRLRAAAEDSLRRLGTDYVDLLLLHWPSDDVAMEDSLGAMEALRHEGGVRLLGVSNYTPDQLRRALAAAPVACNQVEYHVFLDQSPLLELAELHDLFVTAYAPVARGAVAKDPTLREIAEAHGRTPGQVALRWLLDQPRVAVIPKAASPERRRENLAVFDFELTDEDRRRIDALPKDRRRIDPAWAPDWEA